VKNGFNQLDLNIIISSLADNTPLQTHLATGKIEYTHNLYIPNRLFDKHRLYPLFARSIIIKKYLICIKLHIALDCLDKK
jgi:hypothetical protein